MGRRTNSVPDVKSVAILSGSFRFKFKFDYPLPGEVVSFSQSHTFGADFVLSAAASAAFTRLILLEDRATQLVFLQCRQLPFPMSSAPEVVQR